MAQVLCNQMPSQYMSHLSANLDSLDVSLLYGKIKHSIIKLK